MTTYNETVLVEAGERTAEIANFLASVEANPEAYGREEVWLTLKNLSSMIGDLAEKL